MSDINKYDYKDLTPFKWFVLENFPFIEADFDAITNYQLFCKVVEYLNKTIESVNNIGNTVEEFTEKFINLKNFVDNYFENLDVQEEINNKLDQMVEDGTFEKILQEYINKSILIYNTITEMKADSFLKAGMYCKTKGLNNINDGGEAYYLIKEEVPNFYYETLNNGFYAELIVENFINLASIDGLDIAEKINNLRPYMREFKYKKIKLPSANNNNNACYIDTDNRAFWKTTNPIVLDDNYNCCEFEIFDRIVGVNNMESILEIGGSRKPENIRFIGFLELLALPSVTIINGLYLKNGARVYFDTLLVNYCSNGVNLGEAQNSVQPVSIIAEHISIGYYKSNGIFADSNLPIEIIVNICSLQNPIANNTYGLNLNGIINNCSIQLLEILRNLGNKIETAIKMSNTYTSRLCDFVINYFSSEGTKDLLDLSKTSLTINYLSTSADENHLISAKNTTNLKINNYKSYIQPRVETDNASIIQINTTTLQTLANTSGSNILVNNISYNSSIKNGSFIYNSLNDTLAIRVNNKNYNVLQKFYESIITDVSQLPTPTYALRGKMVFLQNSGSNLDKVYVCVRTPNTTLAWKELQFVETS